jgi:antitoxin component YwqK of YwqJK toxin-antitoxin module
LPDGSIEVTYFWDSVMNREAIQFDEKGKPLSTRAYNGEGKLHSEELRLPNGDDEWKTYDGKGVYSFRRANP